ncbi:MAG: SUMF1/EgtB/PvdO family nonheme iron enzyme [Defluviicoccus sp.]|nr:MAG: SUMF1/EgtB/PvdO family nonheme iron enzyme [Defluviicoccus sp.]
MGHRLKAGEIWDEKIERALDAACCVVVLWSAASITRRWVREEALSGLERHMLVPVVIERVRPPLGFRSVHYEDLSGWAGERDHRNLSRLLDVVGGFVAPSGGEPAGPAWAHAAGNDQFGRWADLSVPSGDPSGPVMQRFRWIESGTFQMGSPDDEPERWANEGPRHRVTLSRGFWLADTACTQALWRAVMGGNPSAFNGDDRPVERVSWDDVQAFLGRLKEMVSGLDPRLPTEAEWEYACRAGTVTPFSFGAQITPEQVNYDGDFPYVGGKKGIDRGETVPVKSLPPNAWELYEMHGNVWEWCADGMRTYTAEQQVDPFGELGEGDAALRAIRGGSWGGAAWRVRSADRGAIHPGNAINDQGFRVSLRSIEPGPV